MEANLALPAAPIGDPVRAATLSIGIGGSPACDGQILVKPTPQMLRCSVDEEFFLTRRWRKVDSNHRYRGSVRRRRDVGCRSRRIFRWRGIKQGNMSPLENLVVSRGTTGSNPASSRAESETNRAAAAKASAHRSARFGLSHGNFWWVRHLRRLRPKRERVAHAVPGFNTSAGGSYPRRQVPRRRFEAPCAPGG